MARIGIGEAEIGGRGTVEHGRDREIRPPRDLDLGAELVEAEPLYELAFERARRVQHEAASVVRGDRHREKIEQDFSLRRQQRGEARLARLQRSDVARHQPLQEMRRVFAGDAYDGAFG